MAVTHRGPVGHFGGRRRPWALAAVAFHAAITACQVDNPTSVPAALDAPAPFSVARTAVPGQYIITLRDSVQDVPGAAAELVRQGNATLGHTYRTAIKGFSATMSEQAATALANNPRVASIEPDMVVEGYDIQSDAPWATDRIDQRNRPLDYSYWYANTGAGVNVYILDTGILTSHVQFGGRASSVFSAFADGNGGGDCNGHGTYVAGLVGSEVYGAAKAVRLNSVRVLGCDKAGTTSSVVAGLDWLAANRTLPAVANMSFGLPSSSAVNQAVSNVINAGVTVVAAAGNSGIDACQVSPAGVPAVITVGGSTSIDAMASWSNRGTCVDLFAPGTNVYSTGNNGYVAVATGSSSSAALASGAAAMLLAANPSASPAAVQSALIGAATTGVMVDLTTGTPNRLLYTGSGSSQPPPGPEPEPPAETDNPPTASFSVSCRKLVCNFDGRASTDDNGSVSYLWNFGDGQTDITATPSHTYGVSATYNVVLTVTDSKGQKHSATKTVRLKGR